MLIINKINNKINDKMKEMNKMLNSEVNLNEIDLAYIAGFLDADGSILTKIVKNDSYIYGFTIRVSIIFYQKTSNK